MINRPKNTIKKKPTAIPKLAPPDASPPKPRPKKKQD